jgi:hypothetical protein
MTLWVSEFFRKFFLKSEIFKFNKTKLLRTRKNRIFKPYVQKLNIKRDFKQKCGFSPPIQISGYATARDLISQPVEQ